MRHWIVLVLAICWFGPLTRIDAGFIDIRGGNTTAASWGPGAAAYGQTFTVADGDSLLLDYSFSISSQNSTFPFVSQVYGWNGHSIVGNALYTSDVMLSPPPTNTFTQYTFSPSIAVTPGQQYIAIVTNYVDGVSLGDPADGSIGGAMLLNSNNPYTGGNFTFASGSDILGDLRWSPVLANEDAVFHADFGSADVVTVPEPANFVLACAGGACFLFGMFRRRTTGRKSDKSRAILPAEKL